MGGYLLDTHAVLWAITEPTRLGTDAHRILADPATDVAVSAVSPWELSIKHRSGKLDLPDGFFEAWPATLQKLRFRDLAIDHRHAVLAGGLPWEHRDPFDRMLFAQALIEGRSLITADAVFTSEIGSLVTPTW